MEFKDYYAVLGVERDATQDEIKRAYRRLARKYHPDVSQEADADARFKELGEAYEVLKDPEKRLAYDRVGQGQRAGEDFRPPPDWDAGFEFRGGGYTQEGYSQEQHAAFSDFFESLFGQRRGSGQGFAGSSGDPGGMRYRARGEDHHAKVSIALEDAYRGAVRTLTLQSGELDEQGRLRPRQRTLKVRIPKGVKQGQRIRLAGQGEPGMGGGPAGDLYLEIEFESHRRYQVEGRDVTLTLPVAPWEAALGATIAVPLPEGSVELKVPADSQDGRRLRLKGRGIPGEPPGDCYVALKIVLPPATNDDVKAAYRQLEAVANFNPRATAEGRS
ncbi:MAG: cytochrome C biogenesis protein [Salinicola sp.]|uniref:DnaJ C-terminal domain-containing protein n=1 Tax=uncultured Salinicola sp. TaxID=1193542 RepID=UPI000C8F4351|nr:DnaJ C-terminal domain-containing protein [uncultured Salinicola sp.]MAM56689.1 cytochrome C biogenesis protein [Salinicola sp.]